MDETNAADGGLDARLREIESAAPAVAPIVEAAVRNPDDAPRDGVLNAANDPLDVVLDQREAMARAVEMRDDPSLSEEERAGWGAAVEQLARARHEAKEALADRRRENPDEETWSEVQAESIARARDGDPDDRFARGAPAAPGDDSGRDEPSAWQRAHDRVGSETGAETTPSDVEVTDQLTSGPGLAGGTGGAGTENYPADTGADPSMGPLAPNEDVEPPDIGHR
jgi:hypothetical protein